MLDSARGATCPMVTRCSATSHLDLKQAELGNLGSWTAISLAGDWTGTLVLDTTGHQMADLEATDLRLASGERKFGFEHFRLQALYASDSLAADLDSDALKLTFRTNTPAASAGETDLGEGHDAAPDLPFQPDPTAELRLTPRSRGLRFTGLLVPDLQALEVGDHPPHLFRGIRCAGCLRIDIPVLTYDSVEVSGLVLTAGGSGRTCGRTSASPIWRGEVGTYPAGRGLRTRTTGCARVEGRCGRQHHAPPAAYFRRAWAIRWSSGWTRSRCLRTPPGPLPHQPTCACRPGGRRDFGIRNRGPLHPVQHLRNGARAGGRAPAVGRPHLHDRQHRQRGTGHRPAFRRCENGP